MHKRLYPFIRAWGLHMGSFPYYVENEVQEATYENAPPRAMYRDHATKEWKTVDDMMNLDLKLRLEKSVRERWPQWSGA